MRINYSGDKRRRELALKQKKEEKAKKLSERRALKSQQTDGVDPNQDGDGSAVDEREESQPPEDATT